MAVGVRTMGIGKVEMFSLTCENCGNSIVVNNNDDGFNTNIKMVACTDFSIDITCTFCENKISIL